MSRSPTDGTTATTDAAARPLDAVLLAGGRATRLGGASKPGLEVGGRTLLDVAIDAARLADARTVVVVGPSTLAAPGCLVVREEPPFGGPVAAIAAGLAALAALDADPAEPRRSPSEAPRDRPPGHGAPPDVLVLACDLPQAPAAVARLLAGRRTHVDADGICLVDADGRTQWLTAVYDRAALDGALARLEGGPDGAAMRHLVGTLSLVEVADGGTGADVDTWPDLERARERARIIRAPEPAGAHVDLESQTDAEPYDGPDAHTDTAPHDRPDTDIDTDIDTDTDTEEHA